MTDVQPRAIAYLRQSEVRAGETAATSLSLRGQEDRFRDWCRAFGITPVGVVVDHDLRGYDATRPGLLELRQRVAAEHIDTLWLLSLSRLAKDIVIHFSVIRDLQKLGVTRIYSELEGEIEDEFFHGILALMHQKGRTEQSLHLRSAFARRALDGGFPQGPAPLGFKRPHTVIIHRANGTSYERETGEPLIDPAGASVVRMIFDRFTEGDSLHAIANDLARAGAGPRGGTWTRRTVRRMIESPIYCGDIAHKGKVVAHNDTWAIVPKAQWEMANRRLTRVATTRNGTHQHWLDDLVVHGCGERMYYQVDSRTGRGSFGCRTAWELPATRCTVERRHISALILERLVRHLIARDLANRRSYDEVIDRLVLLTGGDIAIRQRAEIERRWSDAKVRFRRSREHYLGIPDEKRTSVHKEEMDIEDARIIDAESTYHQDIAALPTMPDDVSIRAAVEIVDAIADAITTDLDRRDYVDTLGVVLVNETGVKIRYHNEFAPQFPSDPVPVPRYGKGWR